MRKTFKEELIKRMRENENIYVLLGDLGYSMFDDIRNEFPDRCINVGASEQAMIGIACGLSLSGKIPFVYSITNFVLYRPFEFIRNYLVKDGIVVHLLGAGRDFDYSHDGHSHHSHDVKAVLEALEANTSGSKSIKAYFPETNEEISSILDELIKSDVPTFTSLKR